ncbi:acyl-CoA dehydrogenase [Streptomyces sp. NPDC004267]|uniref:acyl-CoA dehydrogenase n=1 Tax=Streptomyces sp. NPDC004267 TaxID=3364694 RepID=UPI0036A32E69
MGIAITHEQRELARSVRGWLTRAVPPGEVRAHLDAPGAAPGRPAYWDAAAAQGLLGIHLPEEYGGGGGDLVDLAVVLEEAGRSLLPGPYLPHVLAAELLRRAGRGEPAGALAAGERIGAVAWGGPGSLTVAPSVTADGLVLDGVSPPVLGAAGADLLILAAHSQAHGTVWLAVDAGTVDVRPHDDCADPTRPTAEVAADGVAVPADRLLTGLDSGTVHDLAAVLCAAEACGTAARAVETAAEHARTRVQFGRPIGQFQGVKHLCADMLVRLEQARALVWDAARAAREDVAAGIRSYTAALAAGAALDAAYGCAKDCIQVLGGIGFTWEHDAHLYLRRALVARELLGTGDAHRLAAVRHAAAGTRRELRVELPEAAAEFRRQAREVLSKVVGLPPREARRELAGAGYAAPHLPKPYGLGAGPVQQLAVQREMADLGVALSPLSIATWVIPSLLAYGSAEQQTRHLGPTLRGEQQWCQLFSEPEAGSDLASLRTRAERGADGSWRVNGQKVWTSAAQWADYGILLARTDPDAPKHRGLTYFVVDMKNTPGITIRPLKEITGDSLFNEVFFDDVPLPADAVVGEIGGGWQVARNTLGNERVHMADQVAFDTGLESLIAACGALDSSVRVRVGALVAEAHALACIGLRTTLLQVSGLEAGPGASVRKLVQTLHQQKVAELTHELRPGKRTLHGLLMSRCLTIAGGTTQVQLNVVAERLLGLPRD